MKIATVFLVLGLLSSTAFSQELTTAQVLTRLDEKAKVFTSLEASISQAQVVADFKQPVESGKIFMKSIKTIPAMLLDITSPKKLAKTVLVRDGNMKAYFRETNGYRESSVDPKSNSLQLLLTGFGLSADTIKKFYTPQVTGKETIDGVATVVLDLTPINATGDLSKVTLWLDTKAWTPVQTRVTQKAKGDYVDFKFSMVKLNKGVSDSTFKLDIPKSAKKQ